MPRSLFGRFFPGCLLFFISWSFIPALESYMMTFGSLTPAGLIIIDTVRSVGLIWGIILICFPMLTSFSTSRRSSTATSTSATLRSREERHREPDGASYVKNARARYVDGETSEDQLELELLDALIREEEIADDR